MSPERRSPERLVARKHSFRADQEIGAPVTGRIEALLLIPWLLQIISAHRLKSFGNAAAVLRGRQY